MKTLHKLTALAVLTVCTLSLKAQPMIEVGDSVSIFTNSIVAARYQSNVFNAPEARDDFVFIFGPGFEVDYGRNSAFSLNLRYRWDYYVYTRFSQFDIGRHNLFLNGSYNSGPASINTGFSFVQTQQNNRGNNINNPALNSTLIRRDLYDAFLNGQYDFSPKYWMRGGFEWYREEFTNNQDFGNAFTDRDRYSIPVDFFYRVTPKWSIGPGIRYRYTDLAANPNTRSRYFADWFFNVAVTGELFPKLDANINIGYQIRDGNTISDDGSFSVLSGFTYYATEKLTLFLDIDKDFETAGQGDSVDDIGTRVGARYQITPVFSSQFDFNYDYAEFQNNTGPIGNGNNGRKDNTFGTGVSVSWTPNPIYSVTLAYGFYYLDSNQANISYRAHTINLQASVRY